MEKVTDVLPECNYSVQTSGWPLRSHVLLLSHQRYFPDLAKTSIDGGIRLDHHLVPARPIWGGLLVNSVFYTVLLWPVIRGPFALRRILRTRRGLCPACA